MPTNGAIMQWIITGRVVEHESSAGIGALWVRATDRDEQAPDLESGTVTNEQGAFTLTYEEAHWARHQNDPPEILVEIIAPPGRTLWQTSLRFGVEPMAPLEVRLSRRNLRNHAPGNPDDRVSAGVGLSKAMLHIREQGGRSWPSLPGYSPAGAPEQPIVLERIHNIVLPLGDDAPELIVYAGEPVRIPLRTPPALRPPAIIMHDAHPDGRPIKGRLPYTVLHASTARVPSPPPLARIEGIQTWGPVRIVNVALCPLLYDADRNEYLLYPDLRYEVRFDMARARRLLGGTRAQTLTREDAVSLEQMLSQTDRVFRAKDLLVPFAPRAPQIRFDQFEHVIITVDDFREEFEKLSRWKMKRGVQSRVVTLEDIKKGDVIKWKDFKESARDDAEIVRNFIRWIHSNWSTKYVLLGGDVDRIPIRRVTCLWNPMCQHVVAEGDNERGSVEVLHGSNGYSAKLSLKKVWIDEWKLDKNAILVTHTGLKRIPYNDGISTSNQTHWHFTGSGMMHGLHDPNRPTTTVIVHGPKEIVDDDFHFVLDGSLIPTDLYYECLSIPAGILMARQERAIDWDANNNRLHGEFSWQPPDWFSFAMKDPNIEPWTLKADVFVGRVPASSANEVANFVNKVKAYESLGTADGKAKKTTLEAYLGRSVLAAAYHWTAKGAYPPAEDAYPPAEGTYHHKPGSHTWTLNLYEVSKDVPLPIDSFKVLQNGSGLPLKHIVWYHETHRLFAHTTNAEIDEKNILIPFSPDKKVQPRWFYIEPKNTETTKPTDPDVQRPWPSLAPENTEATKPTDYVMVEWLSGNGDDRADKVAKDEGLFFVWDEIGKTDYYMNTAEQVRAILAKRFSDFTTVERYYMDTFDLAPEGHLRALDRNELLEALRRECHFVSLNSHGGPEGCCWLDRGDWPFDPNAAAPKDVKLPFIAYALSCSTARPDDPIHSFGEQLVVAPDGAVAYVGSTRTTWPDATPMQVGFWDKLGECKRLGDAASHRRSKDNVRPGYPIFFTQILYGDPEMPIWGKMPRDYNVKHPNIAKQKDSFVVTVKSESMPVENQTVTLLLWPEGAREPTFHCRAVTNAKGEAKFRLPNLPSGAKVDVTVSGPDYIPHFSIVRVD